MSGLLNKNVRANNRRTSIRLDKYSWNALEDISKKEKISINDICSKIDEVKKDLSLTTAVRAFLVSYYRIALSSTKNSSVLVKTIDFLNLN